MSKHLARLAARGRTLSDTARLLALEVLPSNRHHRLRAGEPCVLTRAALAAELWSLDPKRVTDWRKRKVGAALHELADAGLIGLDVTQRHAGEPGEPGAELRFTVRRIALTDTAPADPHAQPGLPLGPLAVRTPKPKAAKPKPKPKRTAAPPLKPAARKPGPDRQTATTRVWSKALDGYPADKLKAAFRRKGG